MPLPCVAGRVVHAAADRVQLVPRCRRLPRAAARLRADGGAEDASPEALRKQYTGKIRRLGRERKPKQALDALSEMVGLGIAPDTVAATAVVDACVQSGETAMAREIFDNMFGSPDDVDDTLLYPDEVAFNVLIRGMGAEDPVPWDEIGATLRRMERDYGIAPGITSYNALLSVCCRVNDVERAQQLVERMELLGIQADGFTWDAVKSRRSMRSLLKRLQG
ncbi:unnamed protein product [Pedinophyceae sp. YPF-701]|nr:unnamed protein product [Pedinophyceae sp. YPF-701]